MRLAASLIVAGLLTAGCSQLVILPPAPDGSSTEVDVTWKQGNATLDKQGYAFYADRIQKMRYRVSEEAIERDFGPALTTQRELLQIGLPELAHSYAVLLPHVNGPLGSLSFSSNDASIQHQLLQPAAGVFIDGYPDQPRAIDSARLQRDFGSALEALGATEKTMRSYLVLLESPDGADSKVVFRTRGGETLLATIGQSLTLDGIEYEADGERADADFSPARTSTQQILEQGLPHLAHSYAALVQHPSGPLGEVEILEGINQGIRLDQPGSALLIDGYSSKVYALTETQYSTDFGEAMVALPPLPVTYLLYFEIGSTQLTRASRANLQTILEQISARSAVDVSITGHTDTVGGGNVNDTLSRKRSEAIAAMIQHGVKRSGIPVQDIRLAYHGKTLLAVETPDNTPELLNRRVEVSIR
jgi:hypothetical protein